MRKIKKPIKLSLHKKLKKTMIANDPRPMKIWWAEYKKEEKELEDRKETRKIH